MNETNYTAQYEYLSRGAIRGGMSWSTKQCQQVLKDMGFMSTAAYEGSPPNSIIQKVQFKGTREQILTQRRSIRDQFMTLSGGRMAMKFKLLRP